MEDNEGKAVARMFAAKSNAVHESCAERDQVEFSRYGKLEL